MRWGEYLQFLGDIDCCFFCGGLDHKRGYMYCGHPVCFACFKREQAEQAVADGFKKEKEVR